MTIFDDLAYLPGKRDEIYDILPDSYWDLKAKVVYVGGGYREILCTNSLTMFLHEQEQRIIRLEKTVSDLEAKLSKRHE